MSRFPTFPTLYDEVPQISTTDLKRWGFLEPKQFNRSIITWNSNENITSKISIHVNTVDDQPYIELNYKYDGMPYKYTIKLVSIPSNLGKGLIWYFLCPNTLKRCRKLYSVGEYFLHREAFLNCMYECQTNSKQWRNLKRSLEACYKLDNLYKELYKKYSKIEYAGKPTKRYSRIIKQIDKIENRYL